MLDVVGHALTDADRTRLLHPLTGGVILFARNYAAPEQIAALTAEIRAVRSPELLIAVDHEGGRVQRFRTGFTALPPMRELGAQWDTDRAIARRRAEAAGFIIATELASSGVDFSFTPVLDLDFGPSSVIGDRSFHRDPSAVSELAMCLMTGLARGGVVAVGKHFPGHGFVAEDSHTDFPIDRRSLDDIRARDLVPFTRLAALLAGIMPAHVIYSEVDDKPAGFSRVWLRQILREELGFEGVVFSDDLSMAAASVAGGIVARADAALSAGCDVVLVCNRPLLADELLAGLNWRPDDSRQEHISRMRARPAYTSLAIAQADALHASALTELTRS
ncbi:MAG: beta-N-acetylhexosaminidase [Betaproteobacteria bacterium]